MEFEFNTVRQRNNFLSQLNDLNLIININNKKVEINNITNINLINTIYKQCILQN